MGAEDATENKAGKTKAKSLSLCCGQLQEEERLTTENLVGMSRLIKPHTHHKVMRSWIIPIKRLSGGTRKLSSMFKRAQRARKGDWLGFLYECLGSGAGVRMPMLVWGLQ